MEGCKRSSWRLYRRGSGLSLPRPEDREPSKTGKQPSKWFEGRCSRKLSYTLSRCSWLFHTRSQSDRFGPNYGLTMKSAAAPSWAYRQETHPRARRGLAELAALSIFPWNSIGTPGPTPPDPRGDGAQRREFRFQPHNLPVVKEPPDRDFAPSMQTRKVVRALSPDLST